MAKYPWGLLTWTFTWLVALLVFIILYSTASIPKTMVFKEVQAVGYRTGATSDAYQTVDGVSWNQGRVLLLEQPNLANGFYVKVNGQMYLEQPIESTSLFEVGVLYGETFAEQQLFLVGPTMTYSAFASNSSPIGDSVTNLTVAGNSTVGGDVVMGSTGLVNGRNLSEVNNNVQNWPSAVSALSEFQITQLANMGANTISTAVWSSLGALDQNMTTTAAVTFAGLSLDAAFSPLPIEIVFDTTPGADKVEAFPAGATGLIVEVQAGGGGGGSRGSTNDCGGGGGSGSLAIVLLSATQMASHTGLKYTIGSGGSEASSGTGSTLSWSGGSEDLIVTTFPGTAGGSGNSYGVGGTGGALPTFESGYFGWSKYGEYGTNGYDRGSDTFRFQAGQGGNTLRGPGARGSKNGVDGAAVASTLGGGGGGGINQTSSYAGSAGGDGYVRILAF